MISSEAENLALENQNIFFKDYPGEECTEKTLLTYQFFSFCISPGIDDVFGVSARILAYQVRLEYVWKYRIRGCFHPVHVHFSVFLEPTLSSLHSIHDKAVPATGVCLPARATGVVTRFLLHDDAASVMRPCSVMRGDDSAPAQAEMMRGDDSAPAQAEMCAL